MNNVANYALLRCKIFSLEIRECNFFDKYHVWLYPNEGLSFTGERLCWSVRGKKEDRGPDLPPSTASFLSFFRHNCSFKGVQRSFYSTLIDLQWSPTKLVSNLGCWCWGKKLFLSMLPNNHSKLFFLLTFKTIQFGLISQTFNYVIFKLPFFMLFFSRSVWF